LIGAYLTPYPSPARTTGKNQRYLWLYRGVLERGGFAPSHILSPFQTKLRVLKIWLFERGSGGEYLIINQNQIKPLVEMLDRVWVIYYDIVTLEQVFVARKTDAGFSYG